MPIDLTDLNASIAALTTQVEKTETTDDGAAALIAGIAEQTRKAVTAALTEDAAANAGSIAAANAAITAVEQRFAAANDKLAAALLANTPAA